MAQDNVFGHLLPSAQPAAPAETIIKRADPYRAEDQQFQRDAAARAAQDQAVQMQRLQMERERDARQKVQDQQGTESERTAGYLTGRMKDAVGRLAGAAKKDESAIAPTLGVEAVRGVFGDAAANYLTDDERQVIRAAQLDILDAALTLGTGAAYTKPQLEGYRESYFPQLGDGEDAKRSKNEALRQLLVNARVKAGRAAPDVDAAIAALDAINAPEGAGMIDQQVKAADGSMITFKVKQGATEEEIKAAALEALKQADPANRYDASVSDATKQQVGAPGGFWSGIGAGTGDIVEGLANNTVGLVSNPVSSVIGRAMGYEGYTADLGQTLRDALQLPEGNQTASAVIQAAAGGLGGAGMARSVGGAIGSNALMQYGATPVLDTITGATAAASGEAARQMGAGPGGQALATLLGGSAPSLAVAGKNALGGMGAPPRGPTPNMGVVRAGERQNIPVRAPDAQPELRGNYAALESGERSGPMISRARASDAEAIDNRAVEIAGGTPYKPDENTAMGQRVQANARAGQKAVKDKAGAFYQRVGREAPGFTTPATRTATFIDAKIAELQARSPSGYTDEVNALKAMKLDLEKTGLSVETLQAQRETVGGRIGDNVQARTRADKTFTEVLDAAAGELHDAMKATNPQAAAILKRADAKWGQYKRLQKEVTGLFLGKRDDMTPEAAARTLNATAKNNYEALRKFMTIASDEDKADFAATFARNWGSDQRGNFTPAAFAKSMEKVGDRTLDALVGVEGRKALRDLQVLSNAKTDAMSRMAPSGKAISGVKAGLRSAVLGALGLSQGGVVGGIVLPVAGKLIANIGEERAARLMLNPDFTKWLRAMPEATNPKAINAYFGKLKASAVKSQVVANDIDGFTNAVMEAFGQSPGRAAAQEEDNGRVKPPQQ